MVQEERRDLPLGVAYFCFFAVLPADEVGAGLLTEGS